jgi:hypothetical protein
MAKVQPGKLPDETRLKEKKGAENFFWRMTMGSRYRTSLPENRACRISTRMRAE